MVVLKAGTRVKTVIGDLEAFVTAVSITMDTVEYRIMWLYNGEEKIAWVYRYEIEVSKPKQSAGFKSTKNENLLVGADDTLTINEQHKC